MKKLSYKGYTILIACLLLLMSLSIPATERLRGSVIALFSHAWKMKAGPHTSQEEIKRLQLENQLLHAEMERIQEYAMHERLLHDLAQESHKEVEQFLSMQLQAIPARVIFRTPSLWNSCLWLNVGQAESEVIAKNSPVMVGTSVIGVVDYVGSHQCRVRLITDSGLNPAVRVARGTKQIRLIIERINALMDEIEEEDLIQHLQAFKEKLKETSPTSYLAKGELSGCSLPMWRTEGQVLKGVGFNYDYADAEGPARDLRTGLPVDSPLNKEPLALIRKNDLLVTTGMDGVFPAGLNIAKVTGVNPLKEGDYFYEIEAIPTAGNLNEIKMVLVLPPVGFNPSDRPPVIGW